MTKTNLMLVHDSSAPAFDPAALRDNDGEPRMAHRRLADALGYEQPHKLGHLIERNRAELLTWGEVPSTMDETSEAGGRPGKLHWLNEGQALVICALSRTPAAAMVRKALIECFLAYRRGILPAEVEAAQNFAQLASEVAELRQRIALIGAAPHIRAVYRGGAYIPGGVGLSVRDISMEHDFEPRVFDERIGVQLGLPDPGTVRALVRSHRGLMSGLGRVIAIGVLSESPVIVGECCRPIG